MPGKNKFGGLWPVMLTPFKTDKSIDLTALDRLTDFYLESGATGLFTNCLSSEMFELTDEERLTIIRSVVKQVNGRVPVAATGSFGGLLKKQAEFIKKVSDSGVSVVVLVSSFFAGEDEDDKILEENLFRVTELTGSVSLGLYECPLPYKRLLPPDLVKKLADTRRYLYLKDTTCQTRLVNEKVDAVSGSSLSVFNANTPTGLDTLRIGADGLSPISANFYPELYSRLFESFRNGNNQEALAYLNDQLILMDGITRIKYPMSAKIFLGKRGLKIEPVVRIPGNRLTYEEGIIMSKLFVNYKKVLLESSIRQS